MEACCVDVGSPPTQIEAVGFHVTRWEGGNLYVAIYLLQWHQSYKNIQISMYILQMNDFFQKLNVCLETN